MTIVKAVIALVCALLAAAQAPQTPQGPAKPSPAADLWERSRAAYGALKTYSDTGMVLNEFGVSSQERHSFETAFSREPRRFLFDFKKQGGDRYVIWGDPDAFHTWWKSTNVQQDYPNPHNAGALTLAGSITIGAASKIPTLLYDKAQLPGDFANVKDLSIAGIDAVDGQPCQRLTATAYDVYGTTGNRVNERALTVWVDSTSLLIRKVVEEWKPLPGQVSRKTTTIQPTANPRLDESRFRFAPPGKSH